MLDPKPRRKFLIATWEGGGSVGPALTVARKLVDAGHDVRVMSDACNRPESEATGARFRPWHRAPNRTDRTRESEFVRDWAGATITEGMTQVLLALTAGRARDYAGDVIAELRREGADLVIGSELILGVELACEVLGQPSVVLACNSLMFPVDGAPQAGPPLSPAQQAALAPVHRELAAAFANVLPAYNKARAFFGLAPLGNMWNQVLTARRTLIAVSRTFDFGPERDSGHFAYVGPQLDEAGWADPLPSFKAPGDDRPLVLVSFSTTFQNHIGILQRVVDALGLLPVQALVTLGPTIRPDEIRPAEGVRLVCSAPHNQVMKEASLLVTHGGHGTVARGLLNRLPMLVLPHGRDQDGNAARVAAHGAGMVLPPGAETSDILAALAVLIETPSFRANAERLGRAIELDMASSNIVAELEALCAPAMA